MFKNDNAMSNRTPSPPHHEGFILFFHNLCSWALSLITTDRINLRNQHSIFFIPFSLILFTICSSSTSQQATPARSIRLHMLQLHYTHFTLKIKAFFIFEVFIS